MRLKIRIGILIFFCLTISACGKKNRTPIGTLRINVSPSKVNILKGKSFQFSATEVSASGAVVKDATFVWTSDDPSIVTIDPITGLATASVVVGVAQITATSGPITGSATVGVVSPQFGAPTLTLSGTAQYEDKLFSEAGFTGTTSEPIRNALINVIAIDGFVQIASGSTDSNGLFNFIVTNNTRRGGVYLQVLTKSSTTSPKFEIRNNVSDGALLALVSSAFDDSISNSFTMTTLIAQTTGIGGAFNMLDVFSKGDALICPPPPDPSLPCPLPLLTGYWEPESSEGTFFSTLSNQSNAIFICGGGESNNCTRGDNDEYDDSVIAHEYGHFALAQFSHDDSPGGFHGVSENGQDIRLSWSEGWANFFSSAVRSSPIYVDTGAGTFFFDIENPLPPLRTSAIYTTSELAVAGILWDILDGVASPATVDTDPLDLTFDEILQTVIDIPLSSQATMESFWLAFEAARPFTEITDLQFILKDRQIELFPDQHEPDDTSFPLLQPGIPQHHTLYRTGLNPIADIDTIQFDVEQDTVYTLETLNLTSGTDTFLTIKDNSGNTLFTNDNWNGVNYLGCAVSPSTGNSTCPSNGILPLILKEPLASSITWTSTVPERLSVEVRRSSVAPPSAGQFGSYDIQLTTTTP